MKKHNRILMKITAAALCLLFLLLPLGACAKKGDDFAQNGFSSVAIDEKGKLHAEVSFGADILAAHKGEKVALYELLPGEGVEVLSSREPLAEKKISPELYFRVSPDKSGRSRLYSSFYLGFSNGEFFSLEGHRVQFVLGAKRDPLTALNQSLAKGLYLSSPANAASLGCGHAMVKVGLGELFFSPDTEFSTGIGSFSVSSAALARLDEEISKATGVGIRVSLMIVPGVELSPLRDAAVLDFLCERYSHGAYGTISNLYIGASTLCSPSDAARLAGFAYLALTSRVANGGVFVACGEKSISATTEFFAKVRESVAASGEFPWSASVSLGELSGKPWESTDPDVMSIQAVRPLTEAIFVGARVKGAPASISVYDVKISAEDEALQAASLAYIYRVARNTSVTALYYGVERSDEFGLCASDGRARAVCAVYEDMDAVLSYESEMLCRRVMGDAWDEIKTVPNATVEVGGVANLGDNGFKTKPLFDFSEGESFGFSSINGLMTPECRTSSAWNGEVLYTWLQADGKDADAGVNVMIPNTERLQKATALSVRVLLQIPNVEHANLTLRLTGVTPTGAPIRYESTLEVAAGAWQTATFSVANFTSELAPHSCCNLSLVSDTAPAVAPGEDTAYVFWLHDISLFKPAMNLDSLWVVGSIVLGLAVGAGIVVLLVRVLPRRRKR